MVTIVEDDAAVSQHWTDDAHSMEEHVCNQQSDVAACQTYNAVDDQLGYSYITERM